MSAPTNWRLRSAAPAVGAALILLGACGGDSSGPGGGNAAFTATVDGSSWTSAAISTQAQASAGGNYVLVGGTGVSGGTSIVMTLFNIAAPGTYPLGVGGTVRGGTASVTIGNGTFAAPLSGSAGTVTLTAVSATHITGTFAFTAGADPSIHNVTNGSFDLDVVANGPITVPDYAGSRVGGTLNGAPWNAATVVTVSGPSSGTVAVGFGNDVYQANMIISGWTGTGTYTLNTGVSRQITVVKTGTTQFWGGSGGLSAGTVTVTSATATRIGGTYNVTLMPGGGGASGNLTLTGTFDIGIQP